MAKSTSGLRARTVAGALQALAVCCLLPAPASNPQIGTPPSSLFDQPPSSVIPFAEIPASAEEIALSVETVKVTVHRAAALDSVKVLSSCPSHWNVSGNVVRQVALSSTARGVAIRADATGAQAIVNGHIYQLPRDAEGAVHSLKIENGEVIINGQRLKPLPGSDVPGSCTGPETLEIQVPDSYTGGLVLSCHGASDVQVDSWKGGTLVIMLHNQSTVSTGRLQGLAKAVVDIEGDSRAEIKDISTRAFVANINGSGTVFVGGGSADMSNATISGSGKMVLKGRFRNLRKSINGTGTIQVTE